MFAFVRRMTPRASSAAVLAAAVTAGAAGAATVHRLSISQTSGSLGSQTFLQNASGGGALQGEVNSSANSAIKIPFGVLGEYDASANSVFGIGVAGVSTTGYAVAGEAFGSQPSVIGVAGGTGTGVEGTTPATSSATAIYGSANGSGAGGYFFSDSGNSLEAFTPGKGGVALIGTAQGEGIDAFGYSGTAQHPAIAGYEGQSGTDLLSLYGLNSGLYQQNFIVQANTRNESGGALGNGSDVQVSGDLFVYGHIFQDCNGFPATTGTHCYEDANGTAFTLSARTRSAAPTTVTTYGGRQSLPTVEDFGQAQMAGGHAYVRLDPAFAATTNPGSPYLVFVTPEGDSRGVFTANHTSGGFEIHENAGGRSNMVVDYRIVAKPLGDHSQRFVAARENKMGYTGQLRENDRSLKAARPSVPRPFVSR